MATVARPFYQPKRISCLERGEVAIFPLLYLVNSHYGGGTSLRLAQPRLSLPIVYAGKLPIVSAGNSHWDGESGFDATTDAVFSEGLPSDLNNRAPALVLPPETGLKKKTEMNLNTRQLVEVVLVDQLFGRPITATQIRGTFSQSPLVLGPVMPGAGVAIVPQLRCVGPGMWDMLPVLDAAGEDEDEISYLLGCVETLNPIPAQTLPVIRSRGSRAQDQN
ncbi:hypothetical protein DPEC_G00350560 [Dallia pectoralis]|uniref:Uncharacterized protein n=1 Tax=Dallia pectoralis TaxID=75939 RepID=A0ACC2F1T1_DALPE|nr:hypothetical protein DPEC_G00350560 [Dallia pectoralis]